MGKNNQRSSSAHPHADERSLEKIRAQNVRKNDMGNG